MTYQAKEHYRGERAADYDQERLTRPSLRRKWQRELEIVGGFLGEHQPGLRVADIPSGTGRARPVIEAAGHRTIAADISLDMLLEGTRTYGPAPALRCEAELLPLATGSVDVVVCLRLMQHLPDAAARAILAEFGRVARRSVIVEAPLRQPITPLINLGRRLLRGDDTRPSPDRMLPMRPREFERVLAEAGNLRWLSQGHVTWWGGQTKIINCAVQKGNSNA